MTTLEKVYKPYTYLIGWFDLDRWYYGCEYGIKTKIANPKNLWNSYFTSSEEVKKFYKENGEPDVIEVHRVFNNVFDTVQYEKEILTKINASNNIIMLNKSNGNKNFCRINKSQGMTGKRHSEKTKNKMKLAALGNNNRKGKYGTYRHSKETKEKISLSVKKALRIKNVRKNNT